MSKAHNFGDTYAIGIDNFQLDRTVSIDDSGNKRFTENINPRPTILTSIHILAEMNNCFKRIMGGLGALIILMAGCNRTQLPILNVELSRSLRTTPYDAKDISEIKVFVTSGNKFLSDRDLWVLNPAKIFGSHKDIQNLLATIAQGHTSTQNLDLRNFHYSPEIFHIIAFSLDKSTYGYLKVQISSDTDKPSVARVQMPDGTNSYEYITTLPALLGNIRKNRN